MLINTRIGPELVQAEVELRMEDGKYIFNIKEVDIDGMDFAPLLTDEAAKVIIDDYIAQFMPGYEACNMRLIRE